MPVPKVSIMISPDWSRPAPNATSATPAASASLSTVTGLPRRSLNRLAAGASSHDLSTFAAVRVTPSTTTPGKVTPTRSNPSNCPATSATASTTLVTSLGCGVGTRTRSASNSPSAVSTGAPLTPEPPMSMPRVAIPDFPSPGSQVFPAVYHGRRTLNPHQASTRHAHVPHLALRTHTFGQLRVGSLVT